MTLREVVGQAAALETIERALRAGRVHHAYRFEGPRGVGKRTAAMGFAQALLCVGGDVLGCGTCDACTRAATLVEGLPQHPDLILVGRNIYEPQALGRSTREGVEISVDQIRKIILPHAPYPPHEGRARVFVILAADALSVSAANALLKTLEEPRPRTHFVLVTDKPHRLLPTIHSRTLPIRFAPLADAALRSVLQRQGIADDVAGPTVALAAGSASAALELCDPDLRQARDRFVDAFVACLTSPDLVETFKLSEGLDKDRDRVKQNLLTLQAVLAQRTQRADDDPTRARLATGQRLVMDALLRVEAYVGASLAFSDMLVNMRRIGLAHAFREGVAR